MLAQNVCSQNESCRIVTNPPESAESEATRALIGQVLGRTPSGVFILTAGDGNGNTTGMLASWVQQAAFEPPMVTVAVNGKRYLNDWLQKTQRCGLSLVGETQFAFLKHFGKGFEPDQPAFEDIATETVLSDVPVLTGALGWMAGKITGHVVTGDHVVYAVEIELAGAGETLADEKPMVHIRKNGFGY